MLDADSVAQIQQIVGSPRVILTLILLILAEAKRLPFVSQQTERSESRLARYAIRRLVESYEEGPPELR